MLPGWIGDYNEWLRVPTSTEIMLIVVMIYVVVVRMSGSVEVVLVRIVDEAVMYPSDGVPILRGVELA